MFSDSLSLSISLVNSHSLAQTNTYMAPMGGLVTHLLMIKKVVFVSQTDFSVSNVHVITSQLLIIPSSNEKKKLSDVIYHRF